MRGRRRLVVLAIAAATVVGVPLGLLTTRSHDRPAAAQVVTPAVAGPLTYAVVDDLISQAAELDAAMDEFVRGCMADHGFPQLSQAWDLRRPGTPSGVHRPLRIDPLETGPATYAQAARFGLIGARDGFDGTQAAYVVSRNAKYDQRFAKCRQDFARKLGHQAEPVIQSFTTLTNKMHTEFLQRIAAPVTQLLAKRLTCLRSSGYPTITRDLDASMDTLVTSARITPGARRPTAPWTEPDPGAGQVVVSPPAPAQVYDPSAAEVALARAYVRCGVQQNFTATLARTQIGPREAVIATHRPELTSLRDQLTAATAALERIHR